MHVVYICNEYPPYRHGGIGTFVQTLSQQMVKRGHIVSVVGIYGIDRLIQENDNGVNVFRIPASFRWLVGPFINHHRLNKLINIIHAQTSIDLIEGNELSFGLFLKRLPTKTIIRIQGGHLFFSHTLNQKKRVLASLIEKMSFTKASFFCAVSQFASETTRKLHKGLQGHSIMILPNPVDTKFFRPYPEVNEIEDLIIFTGGLREKKGVRQLVQAMPRVLESFPNTRLWIQGTDFIDRNSGISMKEILSTEMSPSIASHIEFKGPIPHDTLPLINAQACILVYPSWMETQGIVVIEGMSCAKPVIASQTGPGPELIDDGIDGLLCDPYSPESIAEKIVLLLENPALRESLSRKARKKVEDKFSTEVLVNKNIEFYQSCLKSKNY